MDGSGRVEAWITGNINFIYLGSFPDRQDAHNAYEMYLTNPDGYKEWASKQPFKLSKRQLMNYQHG